MTRPEAVADDHDPMSRAAVGAPIFDPERDDLPPVWLAPITALLFATALGFVLWMLIAGGIWFTAGMLQ